MINITQEDTGVDWAYESYMQDNLLSLLSTSTFEERQRNSMENDINDIENMEREKYEKILFNLFSNQLDKVTHGGSYNMGDIKKHLRKLC